MRTAFLIITSSLLVISIFAQDKNNLNTYLIHKEGKRDIEVVRHLLDSGSKYAWSKPELGRAYANDALSISQELNFQTGIAMSYITLSSNLRQMGDYTGSMDLAFRALNIFKKENDANGIHFAMYSLGGVFKDQGDYAHAIEYLKTAQNARYILDSDSTIQLMHFTMPFKLYQAYNDIEIADCYIEVGQDSALLYARKSFS
jgi:tetratricopeptide (TPR) repeat protein